MITRSSIKTQLKGNKMKNKKPVKKMFSGKLASIISPAYGIAKGQGPFSAIAAKLPSTNPLGVFAKDQRDAAKARKMAMASSMAAPKADQSMAMPELERLNAGGAVKRKRPIDGIASKGKTRAI